MTFNILGSIGKGILPEFAPSIAKGALVETLLAEKTDVKKLTRWVQENRSLWEEIKYRESLKALATQVGDINWLTTEFVIDAIREDLPALASLFLGWKKSRSWLDRQVKIIRKEIES